MFDSNQVPQNHPLRRLFRTLADRALTQSSLTDRDILLYLSDLLLDFTHTERLYQRDHQGKRLSYLVDMWAFAEEAPRGQRKKHFKYIGDYSLFVLGWFPESLNRPKAPVPESYYTDNGRRGYLAASELERDSEHTATYRKLADKFERCVLSLNWIREYTTDPFYQYMLRQYDLM